MKTGAAWAEAHARELMGQDIPPVEAARREWETDPHNQFGITGRGRRPLPPAGLRRPRPARRAARRRPGRARLADLGAAAHRRREGGPAVTPFSITDPLPTGTVLLEASAGTGKTWTIGALVTRYVAEGRRPARADARRDVRSRRQPGAARAGARPAGRGRAGAQRRPGRERRRATPTWSRCCARGTTEQRRRGHRRVTEALAGFDAATIATTHQFCSMVLDSLGVAGDTDSRARLVEDLDDLVKETVDDLYLRAFAFDQGRPVFTHAEALAIARAAVGDPQARLEPADEDRSTPAGRKVSFADAVRTELDRRKRRLGILSYDDLLSQLADALEDEDGAAAQRMRQRWQHRAGRRVPGHRPGAVAGARPGLLRPRHDGADRRPEAGDLRLPRRRRHDLPPGRGDRHDPADAVGQLAQRRPAARLLPAAARRRRARRRPDRRARRRGPPRREPAVRRRPRRSGCGSCAARPSAAAAAARSRSARCARTSRTTWRSTYAACSPRARPSSGEPIRPRDVAVISYRHADLAAVREALLEVGVPAVIAGGGSVFATPAAVEWLTLLEALEQPHRSARVRSAALTCFFGHTAGRPRRARRRPHRRGRRHAARLGRAVHDPRAGGGARGGQRRRAARAGARRGRRRPPAHRPAPHRRGAARGRRSPSGTAWSRCSPGCASRSPRAAPAAASSAPAGSTPTPPRCSW